MAMNQLTLKRKDGVFVSSGVIFGDVRFFSRWHEHIES